MTRGDGEVPTPMHSESLKLSMVVVVGGADYRRQYKWRLEPHRLGGK